MNQNKHSNPFIKCHLDLCSWKYGGQEDEKLQKIESVSKDSISCLLQWDACGKKKNAAKQGQTAGKARVVSLSGDTGFVFAGHAGERKFHEWSYSNVSNPVLPTQLNRAAVGKTWTMNALKSSQAAC